MKEFIRNPPAFQFYPSNYMSTIQYRTMSLSERGLMMSMLCECWVNSYVPSDISQLAKILGYSSDEVSQSLSTNVMHFFYKDNDKIISPELEAYRQRLDEARKKQIEGGKEGQRRKKEKEITSSYPQGIPEGSLVEHNLIENNLIKHTTKEQVFREEELGEVINMDKHKEWIESMDKA
ncbi:MAG: hypothetical protein NTZ59_15805 [Bacteroidetes bacterium]|nr:hypothetical protein [Bacteroidota bacterium]